MTHHLVGMAEIAEMLGVSRQRVGQIIETYDDFPKPEAELTGGRIWSRTAVETWIHTHPDRGPGRPEAKKRRLGFLGGRSGKLFQRFTDRARHSVVKAQEEARLLKHNYIGTEHLLLGLLAMGEGVAHDVLEESGITLEAIRDHVREVIGEGDETPRGHIPFTPRAKKVLELSLREALHLGHNYIGTEHVLLGIMREGEGVAWQSLTHMGIKDDELRAATIAATEKALSTKSGYVGTPIPPGAEGQIGGAIKEMAAQRGPFPHPTPRASAYGCAFCGRRGKDVETLVAGPGSLRICNECVASAMEIIGERVDNPELEMRLSDLERRLRSLEEDPGSSGE